MNEILNTQQKYQQELVPNLLKEGRYTTEMAVPRLMKVVVSMGLGAAKENAKEIELAVADLEQITGRRPVLTKARKSIAGFDVREGAVIGAMVTLRGQGMYQFLDKLFNYVLPRVRDFQGISAEAFDGKGNYSLGLEDQLVFLEIDPNKVARRRGLQITIVSSANTDEEARQLLEALGAPFRKEEDQ